MVIIGILAAITIVSYTGVTFRANTAVLQSDLSNAKTKLAIYQAENGSYPTSLDNNKCPLTPIPDTNNCLKSSNGITLEYNPISAGDFNLYATKGTQAYSTTASTAPSDDSTNWITIGSQRWSKTNLNVGTMVTGTTTQTNNQILEKYCYDNKEANCTTYGALYQWDEAMQYVTTEKAKGICPVNSHIPSDTEWKTLEMQLGMTQIEIDKWSTWRGTDQGAQLKIGGSSGLAVPLAGYFDVSFNGLLSRSVLWTSTESSPNTDVWLRGLAAGETLVDRGANRKDLGFSVRCLAN